MSDYSEQAKRYLILIEGRTALELLGLVAGSARVHGDWRDARGGRAGDARPDRLPPRAARRGRRAASRALRGRRLRRMRHRGRLNPPKRSSSPRRSTRDRSADPRVSTTRPEAVVATARVHRVAYGLQRQSGPLGPPLKTPQIAYGASRTRTGDLLGAISALSWAEFGFVTTFLGLRISSPNIFPNTLRGV